VSCRRDAAPDPAILRPGGKLREACAPWYAPNELPPEVAGVQGKDSEANNLPGPERERGQEPVVEARNDRRCVRRRLATPERYG
jgi:hypothetical protein